MWKFQKLTPLRGVSGVALWRLRGGWPPLCPSLYARMHVHVQYADLLYVVLQLFYQCLSSYKTPCLGIYHITWNVKIKSKDNLILTETLRYWFKSESPSLIVCNRLTQLSDNVRPFFKSPTGFWEIFRLVYGTFITRATCNNLLYIALMKFNMKLCLEIMNYEIIFFLTIFFVYIFSLTFLSWEPYKLI